MASIDIPTALILAQTLLHRERLVEADELLIGLERFIEQLVALGDRVPREMRLRYRPGSQG